MRNWPARRAGWLCVLGVAAAGCDRPPPNPYEHAGPFSQFALGGTNTCVVERSGSARCWKYGAVAEAAIPAGPFTRISTGTSRACGIRAGGSLACWGACTGSACTPPAGAFTAVSMGDSGLSCALSVAGDVQCWGTLMRNPSGVFTRIDAGGHAACGVTPDHHLVCWGLLSFSNVEPSGVQRRVSLTPPPALQGHAIGVAVGTSHACALTDTGSISCWGDDRDGQATAPAGVYGAVIAERDRSCALTFRGDAVCWGKPISWYGKTYSPPVGPFSDIALGDSHACGRRANGTMVCWGVDQQSQVSGERWMLIRN